MLFYNILSQIFIVKEYDGNLVIKSRYIGIDVGYRVPEFGSFKAFLIIFSRLNGPNVVVSPL